MDCSVLYSEHVLSSKNFWTGLASTIWIMYKSCIRIPPMLQLKIIGNWTSYHHLNNVQWASEIWTFEIRSFWRSDFKWSGFSYSPNHSKMRTFKIWMFLPRFWMVLTKWQPIVQISNGLASGFQIPLKIRTICNSTSFRQFKIQTSQDFRFPLRLDPSHAKTKICW